MLLTASVWVCFCLWLRTMFCIERQTMTASCIMSVAQPFLKALHLQSSLTPDYPQRTSYVSSSSPSQHLLTHLLQTWQNCTQCSTAARDGWGWQIHSFMLFLLFEKAIRADVIKPVCVTEVFWGNSDRVQTLFRSVQTSHQKHQEFWDTGESWQRLLPGM